MAVPMIRFSCECGKRLAAPAKYAGREGDCTKCGKKITVPHPKPAARSSPAPEPVEKCEHPKLDHLYRTLVKRFSKKIDRHDVHNGVPTLRFIIPEDRHQQIQLQVETDDKNREWLVIRSEIGTVTTLDEMTVALQLNRSLLTSRLYLDKYQVLQLESRHRLDEIAETEAVSAVEEVAHWADEFEAKLFSIDVR